MTAHDASGPAGDDETVDPAAGAEPSGGGSSGGGDPGVPGSGPVDPGAPAPEPEDVEPALSIDDVTVRLRPDGVIDPDPADAPDTTVAALEASAPVPVPAMDTGPGSGTGSAGDSTAGGTTGDGSADRGPAWRRLLRGAAHPRLTGATAVIALLIGLLGFALIVQVKANSNATTLDNDRPDDLVRILSDLDGRKDRLSIEITGLQAQQRQLNSGAQSREAALQAAQQRADELGILAGTLPATGPGLVITLRPGPTPLDASIVLGAVEALRDAGAEAMQISGGGGPAVRIVASTWFIDSKAGIVVDGQTLTGSLELTVIGDPQTMQTALTIPGEADDMVKQAGGNVLVEQPASVTVTALHNAAPAKYARPVS